MTLRLVTHVLQILRRSTIPALVVSTFMLMALTPVVERLPSVFPITEAHAGNLVENEASLTAKQLRANYQWNINDVNLPLITLPDHLGVGVDLSLTYSMDQFQFPVFQSLYYNAQAEKYILMVMSEGKGAKFIDLPGKGDETLIQITNDSSLRFTSLGNTKLITTNEGTVYTFSHLNDGELHCRQIRDRAGIVIDFAYTKASSLATITDLSGRTVRFSYTKDYLSSITQTWGPEAKRKKTWAIDNETRVDARDVNFAHARPVASKRVPTNAVTPTYTEEMAASDSTLANIFGGPGARAAANGFEPVGLGQQYPLYRGDLVGDDGVVRRGHLSYAMHLYGSADGTGDLGLYVPAGFTSHSVEPTPTDAAVAFFYPNLGNLTDVTLVVFHVANFSLTPEGARVRIGSIGGRGGSVATYKHSHLEFYRGNTGLPSAATRVRLRIDPATVFGTSNPAASH
ncbi:MAG TPA: hypothetical protein VNO50_19445 [Pyrinomonadaceae bacterium]|nr:hypothetical protein [Pyrinomonadaceae bacterium]